jgi:ribosomal protein S18 acetylase RimI-like enzyme
VHILRLAGKASIRRRPVNSALGRRREAVSEFRYESHDGVPAEEGAIVDKGLGDFNDQAAPLHEVQSLSCFVRDERGQVIGGAVGRRWGQLCELQQLWVEAGYRGSGLGTRLVQEFERLASERGCTSFYLETLSFQAPEFYKKLGYRVAFARSGYPHGIGKYHMVKEPGGAETAA